MPFHSAIKCVVTRTAWPRRGFFAEDFLQPRTPAGIETQAGLIEQENGNCGEEKESEAEALPHAAGERARSLVS